MLGFLRMNAIQIWFVACPLLKIPIHKKIKIVQALKNASQLKKVSLRKVRKLTGVSLYGGRGVAENRGRFTFFCIFFLICTSCLVNKMCKHLLRKIFSKLVQPCNHLGLPTFCDQSGIHNKHKSLECLEGISFRTYLDINRKKKNCLLKIPVTLINFYFKI